MNRILNIAILLLMLASGFAFGERDSVCSAVPTQVSISGAGFFKEYALVAGATSHDYGIGAQGISSGHCFSALAPVARPVDFCRPCGQIFEPTVAPTSRGLSTPPETQPPRL